MAAGLSMAVIKITYVPVTAANRFDAIEKGQSERVYSVRLPALPPKPFWMDDAQFLSFSWRNSSDDKSQFHTRGLIVLLAKAMQLR